jgi:nicotinate-nucleotide adenylyltransferase
MSARPRLGFFGGTFDPVHNGHVSVAKSALQQLALDEVRWVPVGSPWQKQQPYAAPHHRIAMLQLAVDIEPRQIIDEREMHRAGPTYTIDTLVSLQAEAPNADWFLIIGQDQLARLHTWHRWQDVVAMVTLAVVGRNGHEPLASPPVLANKPRMERLWMPPMAESSTEIRQRLARGEAVDAMVPDAVARYIDRHGLYRWDGIANAPRTT